MAGFFFLIPALISPAYAEYINKVEISVNLNSRCFVANGIPDHPIGKFPIRGNPNAILPQQIRGCVPVKPEKNMSRSPVKGIFGIAVNGVLFRPNTAGFWDPNARRGHSRNGNRNWSLDIFGARGRLGLDFNNGHVGKAGLYHYHGIAKTLTKTSGSSLVGYARDGFEVHYLGNKKKSGWRLKGGQRPVGAPPGVYDGKFNEDYEYIGGLNNLDQCNGGEYQGRYTYFITDQYPFVPRCFYGKVSMDFGRNRHM